MRKKVSTVLSFLLVLAFLRPLTKLRWWGKKEEKRARSSSLSPILCVFGGSGNWHCLIWNRAKMWSENSTSRLSKFSGDWRWSWCSLGRIRGVFWWAVTPWTTLITKVCLFYARTSNLLPFFFMSTATVFAQVLNFFFLLEFLPTTP